MTPENLALLAERGVAYDCETHPFQPGLAVPPIVCGSLATVVGGVVRGELLDKDRALASALAVIERNDLILVTANGPFDLMVLANEWSKRGRDVMPAIFDKLERGQVYDVLTAQALDAVAGGHLEEDPRTGRPLKDLKTGKKCRYNLAVVTDLLSGKSDAKRNDEYRERYHELEHVPIEQWPYEARQYPVDDVVNTLEDALMQCGHALRPLQHVWGERWTPEGSVPYCENNCGAELTYGRVPECIMGRVPLRNLHDLANQVYTHFALSLGAAWGFRTDGAALDLLDHEARQVAADGAPRFCWLGPDGKHAGILRPQADGTYSQSLSTTKRLIAIAYGCTEQCMSCAGSGKVPSAKQPQVKCRACSVARSTLGQSAGMSAECAVCSNTGTVNSPTRTTMVNCEACDATGFVLVDAVPRSDGGGVAYGRPALNESGDELLMAFADYTESRKVMEVYVPYLRDGVARPLTLRPNTILTSGRVSYDGVIMLLPREGGVRPCVVSRGQ